MKDKDIKTQFDEIQDKIKESSLEDFKDWVDKWAGVIGQVNTRGDTREMYKAVRSLANKREKPSPNLIIDKDGNLLTCAEDVAEA